MSLILGIDPGLSGALALLTDAGELALLADLPVIRDNRLAWIDGGELQSILVGAKRGRSVRAVVERVGSMPGQGVASTFTFGVAFGSLLGVLQALHIGIELVSPARWKTALGLSKDKLASLDRARLVYPTASLDRVKDHGRAEALLLAHWALTRPRSAAA